jgi:hypothetical protein
LLEKSLILFSCRSTHDAANSGTCLSKAICKVQQYISFPARLCEEDISGSSVNNHFNSLMHVGTKLRLYTPLAIFDTEC